MTLVDNEDNEVVTNLDESITLVSCTENIDQTISSNNPNIDGSFTLCDLRVNENYSVLASALTYEDTEQDCGSNDFPPIPTANLTMREIPLNREGKTFKENILFIHDQDDVLNQGEKIIFCLSFL